MAQLSYPLDDTLYTAEDAQLWLSTRTSGIFSSDSDFIVMPDGAMSITVSPGIGWIKYSRFKGAVYANTSAITLNIEISDSAFNRIDRLVIRWDNISNDIKLNVKRGVLAVNPTAPELQRNSEAYEIAICDISVPAGILALTQANIIDQRLNGELCGIMSDGVTRIPTNQLYDAWWAWFSNHKEDTEKQMNDLLEWLNIFKNSANDDFQNWLSEKNNEFNNWFAGKQTELNLWFERNQNEFIEWFENIKDILSDDDIGEIIKKISDMFISPVFTKGATVENAVAWKNIGSVEIKSGIENQKFDVVIDAEPYSLYVFSIIVGSHWYEESGVGYIEKQFVVFGKSLTTNEFNVNESRYTHTIGGANNLYSIDNARVEDGKIKIAVANRGTAANVVGVVVLCEAKGTGLTEKLDPNIFSLSEVYTTNLTVLPRPFPELRDTPPLDDNSEKYATTGYVKRQGYITLTEATATITTAWTGTAAPYTQTITVEGVVAASRLALVEPHANATEAEFEQYQNLNLRGVAHSDGQITLKASGVKNTIPVPISIAVFG